MPLEIRAAHFLIRSAQLVRGTRLEQALEFGIRIYRRACYSHSNLVLISRPTVGAKVT